MILNFFRILTFFPSDFRNLYYIPDMYICMWSGGLFAVKVFDIFFVVFRCGVRRDPFLRRVILLLWRPNCAVRPEQLLHSDGSPPWAKQAQERGYHRYSAKQKYICFGINCFLPSLSVHYRNFRCPNKEKLFSIKVPKRINFNFKTTKLWNYNNTKYNIVFTLIGYYFSTSLEV